MPQAGEVASLGLRAALVEPSASSSRLISENSSSTVEAQIRTNHNSDVDERYRVDGQPNEAEENDEGNNNNDNSDISEAEMESEVPTNSRTAIEAYTERLVS